MEQDKLVDIYKDLQSTIEDADYVFVGIGSLMQVSMQRLRKESDFMRKMEVLEASEEKAWAIPFLIRFFLKKPLFADILKAYENLKKLIEEKNYFIVSLSTDDLIRSCGFDMEKVALPLGSYDYMQCEDDCQGKLYYTSSEMDEYIARWIDDEIPFEDIPQIGCPNCGKLLVFNQYGQEKYNEKGYLSVWSEYTNWLQKTVNKKLCILELGVGMEFPSIIRWPMEKVCFYNKKSRFFRVHDTLFQLSNEVGDRGVEVKCSPIEFLLKLEELS